MFELTALDLYNSESQLLGIVTLCRELDEAIGCGVPIGVLTELSGSPGAGKTQFCLQLCVNVQIPRALNGLGGSAIFIDTNRGFGISRMKEISTACVDHCQKISRMHQLSSSMHPFTVQTVTDNITCAFCRNYVDLSAVVFNLPKILSKNPNACLIVIDSFSHLFRVMESSLDRTRILFKICSDLQKIAEEFQCAVVVTNELTTRIMTGKRKYITPSMGDSLSHRMNYQITLAKDQDDKQLFYANIDKSFYKEEAIVPFKISRKGIRRI